MNKKIIVLFIAVLIQANFVLTAQSATPQVSPPDLSQLAAKQHPYLLIKEGELSNVQTRWQKAIGNQYGGLPIEVYPRFIKDRANHYLNRVYSTYKTVPGDLCPTENSITCKADGGWLFDDNRTVHGYKSGQALLLALTYAMEGNVPTEAKCLYPSCKYGDLAIEALKGMKSGTYNNDNFYSLSDGLSLGGAGPLHFITELSEYCQAYDLAASHASSADKLLIEENIAKDLIKMKYLLNLDWTTDYFDTNPNNATPWRTFLRPTALSTVAFCSMAIADFPQTTLTQCLYKNPNNKFNCESFLGGFPVTVTDNFSPQSYFDYAVNTLFGIDPNSTHEQYTAGGDYWRDIHPNGYGVAGGIYDWDVFDLAIPHFLIAWNYNFSEKLLLKPEFESIIKFRTLTTLPNGKPLCYHYSCYDFAPKLFYFAPIYDNYSYAYWYKQNPGSGFWLPDSFLYFDEKLISNWNNIAAPTQQEIFTNDYSMMRSSAYNNNPKATMLFIDHSSQYTAGKETFAQGSFSFYAKNKYLLPYIGTASGQIDLSKNETYNNFFLNPNPNPARAGCRACGAKTANYVSGTSAFQNTYLIDGYGVIAQYQPRFMYPVSLDPAYLIEDANASNFGYAKIEVNYGAIPEIGENVKIYRNFLYPNRQYLIIVDNINANNPHKYTNQLIFPDGSLTNYSDGFDWADSANKTFVRFAPNPAEIKSLRHDLQSGSTYPWYQHTRSNFDNKNIITVIFPTLSSETVPAINSPNIQGGIGKKIVNPEKNATEYVAYNTPNDSQDIVISDSSIETDAEIMFVSSDYYFVKNATYMKINGTNYPIGTGTGIFTYTTCHPADTNCDGTISFQELWNYILKWITSKLDVPTKQIHSTITKWKAG